MTTFTLTDAFNNTKISTHRTLDAAIKARIAHSRKLSRNSPGSYVWYRITDADGAGIDGDILIECEMELQNSSR